MSGIMLIEQAFSMYFSTILGPGICTGLKRFDLNVLEVSKKLI